MTTQMQLDVTNRPPRAFFHGRGSGLTVRALEAELRDEHPTTVADLFGVAQTIIAAIARLDGAAVDVRNAYEVVGAREMAAALGRTAPDLRELIDICVRDFSPVHLRPFDGTVA